MSTRLPSCEKKLNKYGNPVGSYFPDERYCFDNDDNLPEFVEMLKSRGYYIGEDGHIRGKKGTLSSKLMARYSDGYSVNASLNRIEEQAQQNLDKLASRRERGVIDGNGDNR